MSELQVKKDNEVGAPAQAGALINMIQQVCVNPEVDVTKLERILDMQERVMDKQAEQAFQQGLAAMQAELPIIEKNGEISVNNVVRSRFAKFEDINKAVLPIMQKHGFAITFETNTASNAIHVIGVLRHKDGHKESTMLPIPLDTSGSKNAVQSVGSSVSYGKRYVMSALLNITTTDDDDDGVSAVPAVDLFAHNIALANNFDTVVKAKELLANNQIAEAVSVIHQDISEQDRNALWVAPTKGGIFTTTERDKIKNPSKFEGKQ